MRPLDRPTMPRSVQQTLARPWVGDLELTAQPGPAARLGNVIARQPRFRFVDDAAAPHGARLVAETSAAERILRDPQQAPLVDTLLGLRALEPTAKLTGVALATSRNGSAAQTLLADLESGVVPRPSRNDDTAFEQLQERVDDISWARSGGLGAEYDLASGWMLLGPKFTRSLRTATDSSAPRAARAAAAAVAGAVLAHETAHAVTPPSASAFKRLGWLEEATADLTLTLPGARERISTALKLPRDPRHDGAGLFYNAQRETLGRVLKLANLDVTKPQDAPSIRQLLQGQQAGHVPRRLATAIIEARGLPPSVRPQLHAAIATAHTDDENRIARLVNDH